MGLKQDPGPNYGSLIVMGAAVFVVSNGPWTVLVRATGRSALLVAQAWRNARAKTAGRRATARSRAAQGMVGRSPRRRPQAVIHQGLPSPPRARAALRARRHHGRHGLRLLWHFSLAACSQQRKQRLERQCASELPRWWHLATVHGLFLRGCARRREAGDVRTSRRPISSFPDGPRNQWRRSPALLEADGVRQHSGGKFPWA